MTAEKRAARIMTWALAAGTAIGIAVFALFYCQTDGWAENTTRPPQAYYQQVTAEALETWPWTYKNKLVIMTGDVREVIDGVRYIDPLVQISGHRLLGGLRVQRQVLLGSEGQSEAIVAIDFSTPPELSGRLTVSDLVRGPRAVSSPLGDEPERPVIEAYEICSDNGSCWSP
jgi:hypothetical protein